MCGFWEFSILYNIHEGLCSIYLWEISWERLFLLREIKNLKLEKIIGIFYFWERCALIGASVTHQITCSVSIEIIYRDPPELSGGVLKSHGVCSSGRFFILIRFLKFFRLSKALLVGATSITGKR